MAQYSDKIHQRIQSDINTIKQAERNYNILLHNSRMSARTDNDAGALVEMLHLLGIESAEFNQSDDILIQFEEILNANSFTYNLVKLEDNWWHAPSHYMLAMHEDGGLIPLKPGSRYYKVYNADSRKYKNLSKSETDGIKYGYIFYKTLPNEPLTISHLIRFMHKNMYMSLAIYVAAAASLVTLLGMVMPYATKLIFSEIIPDGDTGMIWPVAAMLLGIAIGSGVFTAVRSIAALRVKSYMEVTLQSSIAHRMIKLPTSFFKKYTTGEISNSLLSVMNSFSYITDEIIAMALGSLFNIGYLVQLAHYSHGAGFMWIVYFMFGVQILMLVRAFYVSYRIREDTTPAKAKLESLLFNIFKGIQKIKTNGAEARFYKLISDIHSKCEQYNWQNDFFYDMVHIVGFINMGLIFWLVPESDMSLSEYLAFICAYTAIVSNLKMLISVSNAFTKLVPTSKMCLKILQTVPETDAGATIVRDISGSIDIYDLHFSYRDDTPPIFKGLDLHIKAGEYVALVGHSGCGKSTLLRLLLGFERPKSGSIFFDNYDISSIDRSSLRRRIGTCLQDGRLFAGDIMSNITITNPLASEEEVWEALRLAAVDEDVRRMNGGIHHQLDATGSGISGGQRQRMLIARAILARPRILFLDEATSALDNISQHTVTENLKEMNCTRITIAHRLSTIKDCDRIIVLHEGKVAEEGTYDELIAKGGIFTDIAQRQQV